MSRDEFYSIGLYAVKYLCLIILVYVIIRFWQYAHDKFLQTIPKTPKVILYIVIAFLSIIMVASKLLGFGLIEI